MLTALTTTPLEPTPQGSQSPLDRVGTCSQYPRKGSSTEGLQRVYYQCSPHRHESESLQTVARTHFAPRDIFACLSSTTLVVGTVLGMYRLASMPASNMVPERNHRRSHSQAYAIEKAGFFRWPLECGLQRGCQPVYKLQVRALYARGASRHKRLKPRAQHR